MAAAGKPTDRQRQRQQRAATLTECSHWAGGADWRNNGAASAGCVLYDVVAMPTLDTISILNVKFMCVIVCLFSRSVKLRL